MRAVSVLWDGLNPDWKSSQKSCFSKKEYNYEDAHNPIEIISSCYVPCLYFLFFLFFSWFSGYLLADSVHQSTNQAGPPRYKRAGPPWLWSVVLRSSQRAAVHFWQPTFNWVNYLVDLLLFSLLVNLGLLSFHQDALRTHDTVRLVSYFNNDLNMLCNPDCLNQTSMAFVTWDLL